MISAKSFSGSVLEMSTVQDGPFTVLSLLITNTNVQGKERHETGQNCAKKREVESSYLVSMRNLMRPTPSFYWYSMPTSDRKWHSDTQEVLTA